MTGVVLFAAGVNDAPCHRDGSTGCDIYIGDIDLATGVISNATAINDGINAVSAGAQWFPALSPDGRWLAYSDSSANRVILLKLAGLTRFILPNAKFPAFSSDSRRLFCSTVTGGTTIMSVDIGARTLPASTLVTSTEGTDPFPIGDVAGVGSVVFHVEEGVSHTAVPYVHTMSSGTSGPDTRMPCIRPGMMANVPCGHVSVNAANTKIGATGPANTTFWISEWTGSAWAAFAPTLNDAEAAIEAKDPRFVVGPGRATFLGNAAWPLDTILVSTAEAAQGSSGSFTTTSGRLFVVDLATSQFTAVSVAGYDSDHTQTAQASIVLSTTVQQLMPSFTAPTIGAGTTPVKPVHITELRAAVDALRVRHDLTPFSWTDPAMTAGATAIKAAHVTELRTALAAAYQAAGSTPLPYADPVLTAGASPVRAVHISELRAAVQWLW